MQHVCGKKFRPGSYQLSFPVRRSIFATCNGDFGWKVYARYRMPNTSDIWWYHARFTISHRAVQRHLYDVGLLLFLDARHDATPLTASGSCSTSADRGRHLPSLFCDCLQLAIRFVFGLAQNYAETYKRSWRLLFDVQTFNERNRRPRNIIE